MTITPFEALAPQIDAAAASFNTVTLSMSFGLIFSKAVSAELREYCQSGTSIMGNPSTTIKGNSSAYIVPTPRIVKRVPPLPSDCPCIPATIPSKIADVDSV